MKDKEFIELLNLYLDHEISVADAARLEAEVQRKPARYRVYREYCQMHKACALLSPAYAAAAEVPAVAAVESRSRSWMNPFAIGGVMAAAAAVAFVFLNRSSLPAPASSGGGAVVAEAQPVAPASASVAPKENNGRTTVTVPILLGRSGDQQGLATQTLRWNTSELAAPGVQDARFNWIETLQLTSMSQATGDSLRFETKVLQKDAPRNFDSGPIQRPTEYNGFQFQR